MNKRVESWCPMSLEDQAIIRKAQTRAGRHYICAASLMVLDDRNDAIVMAQMSTVEQQFLLPYRRIENVAA